MLDKIKTNKQIKIISILIFSIVFCLFCLPLFQILIEITVNAGRIVGTFIRNYCKFV